MSAYEIAKDFQSLAAASVAFAAAVIAFVSTQRVAAVARRTSLEVAAKSQQYSERAERSKAIRTSTAILIEIMSDLDVMKRRYVAWFALVQTMLAKAEPRYELISMHVVSEQWYQLSHYPADLASLFVVKIKHNELALLAPQTQRNIHHTASIALKHTQLCKDVFELFPEVERQTVSLTLLRSLAASLTELDASENHLRAYLQPEIDKLGSEIERLDARLYSVDNSQPYTTI